MGENTTKKKPKAAVEAIFTTLPEELSATQNISLTYPHAQGNLPIAFYNCAALHDYLRTNRTNERQIA